MLFCSFIGDTSYIGDPYKLIILCDPLLLQSTVYYMSSAAFQENFSLWDQKKSSLIYHLSCIIIWYPNTCYWHEKQWMFSVSISTLSDLEKHVVLSNQLKAVRLITRWAAGGFRDFEEDKCLLFIAQILMRDMFCCKHSLAEDHKQRYEAENRFCFLKTSPVMQCWWDGAEGTYANHSHTLPVI